MFNDNSRNRLQFLIAILLLAFGLRMARVGELRLWGDEAYSVFSAHRSLAAITLEGAENDPHPPLYYYLLHLYMPLAGSSELALRFFSVFPGVATVALVYVIGKRLFGARVGLGASFFAALAPFDIYYSQEIRMYALASLLAALAVYFFVRLFYEDGRQPTADGGRRRGYPLQVSGYELYASGVSFILHPPSLILRLSSFVSAWGLWLAYGLATFFALYSLYHTAFVLLAEGLFLLPFLKTRRAFVLKWFAVAGGTVLLFLPWLAFRFSSTLGHLQDRAGRNILALPMFIWRGFANLTVGTTLALTTTLVLSIIFVALIVLAALYAARTRQARWQEGLVVVLAFVPIVAVYPLYLLLPIFVARLFALAFVPLVLVLARSLDLIRSQSRSAAAIGALALVGISGYSLGDYYFRYDRYNAAAEDYMPIIHTVEQTARAGDVVLFHANWHMGYFLAHYRGPALQYLLLDRPEDVQKAAAQPREVWSLVQGFDLHGSEVWLAQHAFPMGEQKFGQIRLVEFRAGTPTRGDQFGTPVVYSNGAALLGYRLNGEPLESGRGRVTLQLNWQAQAKIADDYNISVRLTDARGGTVWAQEDSPPASGTRVTTSWQANEIVEDRHTLAIPPGTPPGTYAVQIVMYQAATGRAANILAPEYLRAQSLSLGTVAVVRPSTPPQSSALAASHRLDAQWNEIALTGFDGGAEEIAAGDSLSLSLYWQAREKPHANYLAALQLVDAAGKAHPASLYRPANDGFPTTQWNQGETWRDPVALKIPADAAPGDATILIAVTAESDSSALPLHTTAPTRPLAFESPAQQQRLVLPAVELLHIRITAREHQFQVPVVEHPLNANLGNKAALLGYRLEPGTAKPSETLQLVLYWQALGSMDERYAVFVHLLDSAGGLVAQQDNEPEAGAAPTTSWLPGEVIVDRHSLTLPDTLPAGDYRLIVGMYRTDGGQRLPVLETAADSIPLAALRVAAR